jgi:hypothetical protein
MGRLKRVDGKELVGTHWTLRGALAMWRPLYHGVDWESERIAVRRMVSDSSGVAMHMKDEGESCKTHASSRWRQCGYGFR